MMLDGLNDWASLSPAPHVRPERRVRLQDWERAKMENMVKKTIGGLDQGVLTDPALHSVFEAERGQHDRLVQPDRETQACGATSIEGIWTGEIYGPYGWESTGTYVLDKGRVVGGNDRHHSAGLYSLLGDSYRAQIVVHYHGQPRAIFGEKRERFEIVVSGTSKNGVIEAQIDREDRPQFSVRYRMTRRMGLPTSEQ